MFDEDDRSVQIARLPATGGKTLVVTVRYEEGGIYHLGFRAKPRGYYLHVMPIETDGRAISFIAGTGRCRILTTASRFDRHTLSQLAAGVRSLWQYADVLNRVLAENGLELLTSEVSV